ncbi:hypothetical protein ELI43_24340 [Rhizobium leguminosarum]|uniref:BRO-N domain-containing protein n=1 Tax=Rhizobium leguminosarum TaxID=384 RepID=UPI001031D977|nr:BRO family protein [Rhizobium leguminosarum]TAU55731.1 hypothetical protein ELI43_24340 [Rhizobium leguminosarum]
MGGNVSIFNFKGQDIRTKVIDGEPWFVAGDLCAALGLPTGKGSGRWLRGFGVIEKRPVNRQVHSDLLSGTNARSATLINGASLCRIALHSNIPDAKNLLDWVFRDVLPSLYKS